MQDKVEQLSFESIWKSKTDSKRAGDSQSEPPQGIAKKATKRVRKATPRAKAKKPEYAVSLTHEEGVEWRLDCFQCSEEEMDSSYYDHLAIEGLKLELLKLLKRENPEVQEVHIITLILASLGIDVPNYLRVDSNKNLIETDYWSEFEESSNKRFVYQSSSFIWAFYFKDFGPNKKVLFRTFTEYPAEETDISFLVDHEIASTTYPGVKAFAQ